MPYGFFPAYLLWGVSSLAGVSLSPDSNSGLREAHLLARSISAAMSVASIWVVFLIARILGGGLTAALSAVLLAFCFGHVQQAHYYTVDPLLAAVAVLCLYLVSAHAPGRPQPSTLPAAPSWELPSGPA